MENRTQPARIPLPPARADGGVTLRKRKRRLPVRVAFATLMALGVLAICVVLVGKISDGSIQRLLAEKAAVIFSGGSHQSLSSAESTSGEDLPAAATDGSGQTGEPTGEQTNNVTNEATESVSQSDTEKIPDGAYLIADSPAPSSSPIENMTARIFETEYLKTMKSTLLRVEGDAPVCLIIHTHATEGFLSPDTEYYHPSQGELARSEQNSENVTAVGQELAHALCASGVPTVHADIHHDADGAGTAYLNSANTILAYLSKYPSIKYVFDIHRSAQTDADGNILRDSVSVGGEEYARIRLTVSGGSSLPSSSVNANLSLALKLNGALCDYSASLIHPVLISDAVYCDGYAPRTLKIDIGSCASTLQEAIASARLLGEAFSSLLLS